MPRPPAIGVNRCVAGILRPSRGAAVAAVLLMLLGGAAPAQRLPELHNTATELPPSQEPITPLPQPPAADPLKVALGERLFRDRRLSRDGTRACVSCHDTRSNGADGNRRDTGLDGSTLPFNTSTVFNAALSFRYNWQGNFRTLEAQAAASIESDHVMGLKVGEAVRRMSDDATMAKAFNEAYGEPPSAANLLDAIATYERSLLTPGSRFDRWLEGDGTALSQQEQDGYRLFKSLGCVSCHQGQNIGGNLFERYGVFRPVLSTGPLVMRVPSLRNVATTPPYFHDGSAATLGDAVRSMGSAQLDRILTDQEIDSIVAFLDTLTGNYEGAPVHRAPR